MRIWAANTCLVSELVNELLALDEQTLRHTLILLPTHRLATHVIARLGEHLRAFVPPRLMTLGAWLEEFTAESSLVSEDELYAVIANLIEHSGYRHLTNGHEHELRQLFTELTDSGLGEDFFRNCINWLTTDQRSEAELDSICQRINEIQNLWEKLTQYLRDKNSISAAEKRAFQAKAALTAIQSHGLKEYKRVYLVGLTSLQATWLPVLSALAKLNHCQIWLSEVPAGLGAHAPLRVIHNSLNAMNTKIYPSSVASPSRNSTVILKGASPYNEVDQALTLAQRLTKNGLAAHRVAVLVSDENSYLPLLREMAPNKLSAYNLAMAGKLRQSTLGQWLQSIIEFCQRTDLRSLINIVNHPLSAGWLDDFLAGETWDLTRLTVSLAQLPAMDLRSLKSAANSPLALRISTHCLEVTSELRASSTRNFDVWCSQWSDFLEQTLPLHAKEVIAQLDRFAGQPAIAQLRLSASSYCRWLREIFLSQEVRAIGEPLAGVQILRLSEARYLPLDVAIVVGCHEGQLPSGLPRDELVDDFLKRKGGLPGWQALEEMDEQNFRLLEQRVSNLVLCHSHQKLGQQLVVSRFIEQAELLDGAARLEPIASEVSDDLALASWRRAHELSLQKHGAPFDARRYTNKAVSATQLESLIKCPYRFALNSMRVRPEEFDPSDYTARAEGDWLHKVLETFMSDEKSVIFSRQYTDENQWLEVAVDALMNHTHHLGPAGIESEPLYLQLRWKAWPRFAGMLWRLYKGDPAQHRRNFGKELRFGFEDCEFATAKIPLGQQDVAVCGVIDSVEQVGDIQLILDYKRRYTPKAVTVRKGTSPQLPFYASAMAHADSRKFSVAKTAVAYWSILDGELTVCLGGEASGDILQEVCWVEGQRKAASLEEAIKSMSELWQWRWQEIEEKRSFVPDQTDCGLCQLHGTCRRFDPTYETQFKTNERLAARLKDRGEDESNA